MQITAIRIYQTSLPYVDPKVYAWGAGNVINDARATVVEIETDSGLKGVGEFTPCGENYMVADQTRHRVRQLVFPLTQNAFGQPQGD